MGLFELNVVSTLSGIAAVLIAALVRLHWPFRYQYIAFLFKRRPDLMMRWMEASFRNNRTRTVAILDKSTCEIMAGNYELAEKFIVEGLTACKERPTLFNRAMVYYFFYNLSTVYFYRGKYKEALDVAFRVFERDRGLTNALGVIVCACARMGDLQAAYEAFQMLPPKKARTVLRLFCMAEIEAAKGEYTKAIHYLKQVVRLHYTMTMHLNRMEIEKRLEEWTKASSQAG